MAKRCELIGMVLLLVSAGWQVFIEQRMAEVEAGTREYQLHRKLDALMVVIADIRSQQNPEEQKPASMADAKERIGNWKFAYNDGKNGLQQLCDWISWITTAIFLNGSVLIIYGKWLESKEPKAQPAG